MGSARNLIHSRNNVEGSRDSLNDITNSMSFIAGHLTQRIGVQFIPRDGVPGEIEFTSQPSDQLVNAVMKCPGWRICILAENGREFFTLAHTGNGKLTDDVDDLYRKTSPLGRE